MEQGNSPTAGMTKDTETMITIYALFRMRIRDGDVAFACTGRIMAALGAPRAERVALGVVDDLEHDAPERAARARDASIVAAAVAVGGAALAADEAHGLAVPVLHQVEADSAGEAERELGEGEEPVAEVGRQFVLPSPTSVISYFGLGCQLRRVADQGRAQGRDGDGIPP